MKNILAENMRRFGTKNLTEQPSSDDVAQEIDPETGLRVITGPEVTVTAPARVYKLKPGRHNPDNIEYVKYLFNTGEVVDVKTNNVIATTQARLTSQEFIEWLKSNKLVSRRF